MVSIDPGSGALVYQRTPEQKELIKLREENAQIKDTLNKLITLLDLESHFTGF